MNSTPEQVSPDPVSDADIIALAQAERDAGVPDVQTAAAASDAEQRRSDEHQATARPD